MNKWMWISYGLVWLSVSMAVTIGIYVTKSLTPLWAMLIPLMVSVSSKKDDNNIE